MQNDLIDRLSDDEGAFVREIDARFPDRHIDANAERYLAIPRPLRLKAAWKACYTILRSGYVRRGVPADAQQTLGNHEVFVGKIAYHFAPASVDAEQARYAGEIHDKPEVIATDFTPHDPITRQEKGRLEDIAARIIFDEQSYKVWREHEERQSPLSKWVQDCDFLERCLHIVGVVERRYPDFANKMDLMFTEIEERLHTDQGKAVYKQLSESRRQQRETGMLLGFAEVSHRGIKRELCDNSLVKMGELIAVSKHVQPRLQIAL